MDHKMKPTSIRFSEEKDEDIRLALNKASLKERRSKNNIIILAIRDYLKEKGYLDEEGNYLNK